MSACPEPHRNASSRHGRLSPARPVGRQDQGFGLVELLVVMIIVGILCAIAIPTFLLNRRQALETSAEEMMRNLGTQAYASLLHKASESAIRTHLQSGVAGAATIAYGTTLRSQAGDQVVATLGPSEAPTAWVGAVQPWPGRCTRIMASTVSGLSAAITTDAGSGGCGASDGQGIILTASDFLSRLINPYNGNQGGSITWDGAVANVSRAGMLLSTPSGPAFVNGVLSGVITLSPGSYGQGAGLVFHATQGAGGALTGFVFQIDPGYSVNGQPGILLRQWTDGTENYRPLQAVPAPAGFDVTKPHRVQIAVVDGQYIGLVDGVEAMRGTLPPGFGGTQYGMRTWGANGATVGGLEINPTA